MNEPVKYQGGIKTYFQRAETASNFGREVGILYVHAQIRHLEMLAKLGYKDQLLEEFLQINPIGIRDVVKNANIRQSNLYSHQVMLISMIDMKPKKTLNYFEE